VTSRASRAVLAVALCALAAGAAAQPADAGRLGRDIVPTFQSVRLVLDPSQAEYTGTTRIELKVTRAAASFGFHAEGPVLSSLTLRGPAGEMALRHTVRARGLVRAEAERPIPPGAYTLDISFKASFDTRATGLYRTQVGGDWYAFTQFQADDARQAFPCWDEPSFKLPYQVTLVVPSALLALSNTPVETESTDGASKTVVFKRTPPLPSYLVVVAVGPLETMPIPGLSVPGRVVTVKGSSGLTGEAVRITPPILAALEKYFGRPYPFEKLDLVAVPEFWAGAMENPGAVTFRDQFLLLDPRSSSVDQRRFLVELTAHELAHMWFGDMVTMAWWDDLWLNESFASWMGTKVAQDTFPETETALRMVAATQHALAADARPGARAIRQPVKALDNLLHIADELAYLKGPAVLGMFEAWIGPEMFRAGIRAYLAAHEWRNATASDLWAALSRAAGKDVRAPMETFVDQRGVPLVSAELVDAGKGVRLSQRRFVAAGTTLPPARWRIPVGLKYSDGGVVRTKTFLLAKASEEFELEVKSPPVDWIHPNAGERGYYRWSLPRPLLATMAEAAGRRLDVRERVGFVGNVTALLDAGTGNGGDTLRLLGSFAADPDPTVVTRVLSALHPLRTALVTRDVETAFGTYLRRRFGPTLEKIGPAAKPGEAESVSALRPQLLLWLALEGADPGLRDYAKELATAYLADPARVDANLAGVALIVAATDGDRALFDEMRKRFEAAKVPAQRAAYLGALGRFRDPSVVDEALRYSVSPALRSQEAAVVATSLVQAPETSERAFRWMLDHYGEIAARLPDMERAFIPQAALSRACTPERVAAARAFFSEPAHAVPGTDKALAKAVEAAQECIALRARERGSVAAYLRTVDPR
jgi:alanyl aminopeptidase